MLHVQERVQLRVGELLTVDEDLAGEHEARGVEAGGAPLDPELLRGLPAPGEAGGQQDVDAGGLESRPDDLHQLHHVVDLELDGGEGQAAQEWPRARDGGPFGRDEVVDHERRHAERRRGDVEAGRVATVDGRDDARRAPTLHARHQDEVPAARRRCDRCRAAGSDGRPRPGGPGPDRPSG